MPIKFLRFLGGGVEFHGRGGGGSANFIFRGAGIFSIQIEAQIPTQNPETPKKTPRLRELFEKLARTCPCFPMTRVRNATEIVQKDSFR